MNRNGIRLVAAMMLVGTMSACGTTAKKKPSCPVPDGVTCMSATDVYDRTNYSDSVTAQVAPILEPASPAALQPAQAAEVPAQKPRTGPAAPVAYRPYQYARLEAEGDTLVVAAPARPSSAPSVVSRPATVVAPVAATTEPHREPARVMKIRIGAWEDENGSLHGRSDVFTEIEPRRWTVGTRAVQPSPGFALLEGFGQGAAQDAQPAARAGAAGSRPGE